MPSQVNSPIDEATYARLDEESQTRLEWIGGQVVAMAGASIVHAKIAGRVARAINNASPDGGCEATVGDLRVHVEATGDNFYPDVVVARDEAQFHETLPHTVLHPVVVVEVLSPTTEKKDRENKLDAYRQIDSLQHYLLISQNRVLIHLYSRLDETRWEFTAFHWRRESVALSALNISIALEEIYRNLNVPEGLVLVELSEEEN